MKKPKAYVIYGQGIGCHQETAHAYELAGADVELVLLKQLLRGDVKISDAQIINFSGGFLHGDVLGAGMCAANELEHAVISTESEEEGVEAKVTDAGRKVKDLLLEFAHQGNIIYGQCNGFQLLVRIGLLPGIDGDYSKQTVTLAGNDCGSYFVGQVMHKVEKQHFAFADGDQILPIICRHGEGKIMFYTEYGLIGQKEGKENRRRVNEDHVLLRYVHPTSHEVTLQFPHNPNGSVDAIAGLVDSTGRIFGHMAHTEVGVYSSRSPEYFKINSAMRADGIDLDQISHTSLSKTSLRIPGTLHVFKNIVNYFK